MSPFLGGQTADHRQNVGQLDLVMERTRVRRLDHGPVGHGIAIRDAQFHEAATARGQPPNHLGGEIQIGIAGGDKRHECLAAGETKLAKERVDGGHAKGLGVRD